MIWLDKQLQAQTILRKRSSNRALVSSSVCKINTSSVFGSGETRAWPLCVVRMQTRREASDGPKRVALYEFFFPQLPDFHLFVQARLDLRGNLAPVGLKNRFFCRSTAEVSFQLLDRSGLHLLNIVRTPFQPSLESARLG